MQTLKTAIVVLLLMTVMYGCYVSLTASPDPLPEHIAELIEESGGFDDLAIDEGLPDSLAGLGISDFSAAEPAFDSRSFGAESFGSDEGPAELTFSDKPTAAVADTAVDAETEASRLAGAASQTADPQNPRFPKPGDALTVVAPDFNRDYPSTDTADMRLPDPKSLDSLATSSADTQAQPVNYESLTKSNRGDAVRGDEPISADDIELPSEPTSQTKSNVGLANAIRTADRQFTADQPAEALATLSLFYNTPDMTPAERKALLGRLDPLAAMVIYSRKHLLEQPHRVGQAETLMEIASKYDLPWQLLANINGIDDPVTVLPGTELKVVKGPFRAEVDLTRSELTIFLGDLYAGRFPVQVGSEPSPPEGDYVIQDKQTSRTYYDRDGSPIAPGDQRNPYGNMWLDLGKQICIHGSPDRTLPCDQGCISLAGADAEDLLGILGQGSEVTILR